jgi:methyl-accepting chemotaxis protein
MGVSTVNWFQRMQQSIVVKVTVLMGLLVVIIVAMVGINGVLSIKLEKNLSNVRNQDIQFNKIIHQANDQFLNMDDQSNMWVGMYNYGKSSTLVKTTLAQVMSAKQQLNQALQSAKSLAVTAQEKSVVVQAIADAGAYENFFAQVYQLNYTNHKKAADIMYVGNASVSNHLTADLTNLERMSDQRVLLNVSNASSLTGNDFVLSIIIGVIVVLISLVSLIYFRRVIAPIPLISGSLRRIAKGDLTGNQVDVKRADEVGVLSDATNEMASQLKHLIANVAETSEHVAAASQELTASADETAQATNQIAISIQDVAGGADKQMTSTREGAHAMEGIAASIQHVADTTMVVSQSSVETTQMADEGNRSILDAVSQMQSINKSVDNTAGYMKVLHEHSQKVGQIIESITGIAEQTNLLALNAAIEAARAGDQGRGFAVVAEEVRKLAEESAKSAGEITKIIQDIQANTTMSVSAMEQVTVETRQGIEVIDNAGRIFAKILLSTQSVSRQAQEVMAASEEISATTEEITATMEDMAKISENASLEAQSVAAASEEQLASMQEVTASASALSKMAQDLQQLLSQFTI